MPTTEPFPNATICHEPDPKDLRAMLDAAGWTHAELALLAGVTVRTIRRYMSPKAAERGHTIPYPLQFTLEAIARRPRQARQPKQRTAPDWRDRLRAKKL